MKIKQASRVEESISWTLDFHWKGGLGGGFGFDCDADGTPLPFKNESASENYRKCTDGTYDVTREGVSTFTSRYRHPRVGECSCGSEVELGRFTNTCEGCGADYNSAGQRLADRCHWGEETGELPHECV
jgi:hypothetical protein